MEFQIETGNQFKEHIDTVASLRICVLKEYPYLYDGNGQTERQYLQSYSKSQDSVVIFVKDKTKIVGAVTGIPLGQADRAFLTPFAKDLTSVASIFYLGEILLLKEYRHKRIGFKMYQIFEDWVRQKKCYQKIALVQIARNQDDPRKPPNYRLSSEFFQKLGFIEHPEITMPFSYKEIDSKKEVTHTFVYSFKDLNAKERLAK